MPSTRARIRGLVVGLLVVAGCAGGTAEDAAPVMATTTIWADITEQVACGELEVPSLVPAGVDAHSYEPSVRDADRLRNAELVIANGLGLEGHLEDGLADAAADGVKVHEVGASLVDHLGEEARAATAGQHGDDGHDHDGKDPHLWMDPLLVAEAVPGIAEALRQVDGLGISVEDLDRCAAEYADQLRQVTSELEAKFATVPAPRRRIVTDHEALGHFAERFDLQVVGALVPSFDSLAEANPRDLDELEETMREEGVEVVVVEHGSSAALADSLAGRLGGEAQVVELHTESLGADSGPQSYLELLRTDARLIAEALAP